MNDNIVILKKREISFKGLNAPSLNAQGALPLLTEVNGVHKAEIYGEAGLGITYDLAIITLEQIETALQEVGFHLENSLINRFRRALYYFTEENERSSLGLTKLTCSHGCAVRIFAAHYRATKHGCRDSRPEHLRRYL
jgi:hypothetical protein